MNGSESKPALRDGGLYIHIGPATIQPCWPTVTIGPAPGDFTASAGTLLRISTAAGHDWKWRWGCCLRILGFGLGLIWWHCDNPLVKQHGDKTFYTPLSAGTENE